MSQTLKYYGETECQHKTCSNKAYFYAQNLHLCGVHSKKFKNRIELTKRPRKEVLKIQNEQILKEKKEVEESTLKNKQLNKTGHVIVSQIKMMKKIEYHQGYLKVFPNFKHQDRKDGFGCSKLSPMSLGPVVLFDKEICKNLENFHQGSKCFSFETDLKGEPSELYFKNRKKFFEDPVAHRHKSKSKCEYFIFVDKEGKIHKLNYVQSRQFYCNLYERLASKQEDFLKLKNLIKEGTNLQICGYDGREIQVKDVEIEYLSPKKPFGHELVLFHMLTEPDPNKYFWRKYKTFDF